ncbi:aminotransferase class V-fold PLP-dependent enzyme [Aquimarina brevivitae]|uniref:Selenocysteine lyase/cysteine desulfurase n=1 Tax=Aquimarina brevivitae TaxID=323412 RepID=A0A4Q7NYZ6_9FLAO|nr:aminotransferase class V-fold PLP-dependent enzyme [Aquimarina brevivitae]RZS92270.1 selenocysteine lyase/cysteine desulfurase [Aquimarina brevivitae]
MDKYRKEFPTLNHYTYLNTAASGILSSALYQHRQQHELDYLNRGSLFREDRNTFLSETKQTLADFFNHNSNEILLVPNFSLGLNTVLDGLGKQQKVVLLDHDYPAINHAVITKGFTHCYAKVDDNLENNIWTTLKRENAHILICSMVQYISGISLSIDFFKQLKEEFPNLLLIVDTTQACGTQKIDFKNSGIDILGCSGYKWLLAGFGNAFFMFKEGILEQITPKSYTKEIGRSDYDSSYTNLQARLECGHLDTLNFTSLSFAVSNLQTIGMERIAGHNQKLSRFLKEQLINLGLLDESVINRNIDSCIYTFKANRQLHEKLIKQHIVTSWRGNGIRVSVHFYNNTQDVEILIDALKKSLK